MQISRIDKCEFFGVQFEKLIQILLNIRYCSYDAKNATNLQICFQKTMNRGSNTYLRHELILDQTVFQYFGLCSKAFFDLCVFILPKIHSVSW